MYRETEEQESNKVVNIKWKKMRNWEEGARGEEKQVAVTKNDKKRGRKGR